MIIWRYILRAHIAPFLFGTFTIMLLFLLQYLVRWINELVSKGLDGWVIVQFVVLNLSWILVLAVPIGILFSTLMAFGSMSAAHEVTVFKASGMGLFRMMLPVVVIGMGIWGGVFWYTDNVLPDTNLALSTMMRDIQRVKPTFAVEAGQFTTHVDGYTILARRTDPTGTLYGVTIYDYGSPDRQNVLSADTARMGFDASLTRLMMQLYHGEIHQRNLKQPSDYRVISFDRHQIAMPADRFFFESSDPTGSSRGDREMRISEMRQIVDRSTTSATSADSACRSLLRQQVDDLAGTGTIVSTTSQSDTLRLTDREALTRAQTRLSAFHTSIEGESYRRRAELDTQRKYLVEIHKKYAIPAACILFIFVGCPMGIITRGGNFGVSAALSLGFYVLYWVSLIGGEKLADRGILGPQLAMWIGNILLAIIGVVATVKVNYETTPLKALWMYLRKRDT
jgi:lipopolysaccharide export system permease protein